MLDIQLYIHSTGSIAPAANVDEPIDKLLAKEPDYTGIITPIQLRRMSKVIRMGIGAAKECMVNAGMERPDALSIGTAFGCLQDTEVFLSKMVTQSEKMLTPTSFIQSTHNTVGGQIALLAGCYGHNMTYVHGGHSFEHAVINTKLYLQDHPGETVLTGGIDELTPTSHALMQRMGFYSHDLLAPLQLLNSDFKGTLAGEGASFFTLNENGKDAALKICKLHVFKAKTPEDAYQEVVSNLPSDTALDLLVVGRSGDDKNTAFYDRLAQAHFKDVPVATFKQFSGEFATAGAFGLSLLVKGMGDASFPHSFFNAEKPVQMEKIVMINHYCDQYSIWWLEASR